MRKLFPVILALALLLAACNPVPAGEQGNVIQVANDDAAMNAAIQRAQDTLPQFIDALQYPNSPDLYFSIKVEYPYGSGNAAEHLWVGNLAYNGGRFTGLMANEPVYIDNVQMGDSVVVDPKDVSDWMIVDGEQFYGGFSIYVLRATMTDSEREKFDAESGLVFGDEPRLP